jgi:hypothetical protein
MSASLVGSNVLYVSGSGKVYEATVVGIPENPGHACSPDPTVSLEFRDERGKLIRIARVLPKEASNTKRQIWKRAE